MSSSSAIDNQNTQPQEESGWTTYLEDFSQAQKTDHSDDQYSIMNCTPSLISDAANYGAPSFVTSLNPSEFPTRLNFIKASPFRNKKNSYNEDLEDTASSPVNSPKVSSGKHQTINKRRQNDVFGNLMGMEYDSSCLDGLGLRTTTVAGGQSEDDYTMEESKLNNFNHSELRKKGLCLVPVSMLVNHYYLNN